MEEKFNLPAISDFAVIVDAQRDHAAVAKQQIAPGTQMLDLDGQPLTVRGEIYPGHRFMFRPVPAGEWVCQYGQPFAISRGLLPGDPVNNETVENVVPSMDPERIEISPPVLAPWDGPVPEFMGFRRGDGRAGVRNWVLIVPTSNCSSHEANTIAMQAEFSGLYSREKYPNVDGVTAIPHHRGCGCPDMIPAGTPGHRFTSIVEATMRMLGNHVQHPNVAAVLLIELGCEKTNLSAFNRFIARDFYLQDEKPTPTGPTVRTVKPVDLSSVYGKPVYSLSIQACGGTRATIQQGLAIVSELLEAANAVPRTPIPISELAVGLECGGSDAFSGLSANPALGEATDLLIRAGGSAVISEVPEFFGAEHLFAQRAANRDVARGIFDQIQRYMDYAARNGSKLDENPSPGNKEGGLLNITIKSLGAMAKAGTGPVQGVIDYAEPFFRHGPNGLYLMYGPGYDPESVPAMVASGCQIVCFTTGRGSVLGNAVAPVVKIASNTPMYKRMHTDMDVNAGAVVDGSASLSEVGRAIFDEILAVASGKWTKAEENGHREFTIWSEEGISL
jgi:altronate hydrolase